MMSLFSSETVKELENSILNQTCKQGPLILLHSSGSAPETSLQVLSYHFLYVL